MDKTQIKPQALREIQIISRHSSVREAVSAAGLDLSYNEAAALAKIKDLDQPTPLNRWHGSVLEAFVTDRGVLYHYECDIKLLNEFHPFMSVMDSNNFAIAIIENDVIRLTGNDLPRTKEVRAAFKKSGATATSL